MRYDRSTKHILVADDSETYRAIATRVLRDAGYRVDDVADGAAAYAAILESQDPFHLLMLELSLPKLRGLDLIRRIREGKHLADLHLLVVSDGISDHLRRVLLDLKLDAMLTKNHALRELLYQVDAVLFPRDVDERRAARSLGHLPVNYWIGDTLNLQSCFDLSEDGMFIVVADAQPPEIGTRLALRFWLPNGDRLLVCDGEVVWRNTAAGDLRISHPPGMGVRFLGLPPEDAKLIQEFQQR